MEIPVLIQPVPGKGFVATAPALGWSAEGPTASDALANLQTEVTRQTTGGVTVGTVAVPNGTPSLPARSAIINPPKPGENPWLKLVGTLPDDEVTAKFLAAIEEYRRQVDNDPDVY